MIMSPYVVAGLKRNQMPEVLYSVNVVDCLTAVSQYFDMDLSELKQKNRKRKIVYPRQIAAYLMKEYTALTLKEISDVFGEAAKDHSTIIHCVTVIKDLMSVTPKVKEDIHNVEEILFEFTKIRHLSIKHKAS